MLTVALKMQMKSRTLLAKFGLLRWGLLLRRKGLFFSLLPKNEGLAWQLQGCFFEERDCKAIPNFASEVRVWDCFARAFLFFAGLAA